MVVQSFEPKLMGKTWDRNLESELYSKWEKEKIYSFNSKSGKPRFVIDTPPPYPSGRPWHVGAAAHYSQIDMIARAARMSGREVLFPIGIDRNGLPVELYTERKFNVNARSTPREKFIELCTHALDELEDEMIATMKAMGLSGRFEDYYRTDSEQYRKLTQTTFIELWRRGLVYEATRPNNYCIDCGTTIADAEVQYLDMVTKLVHIRFKVKQTGRELIVATTRPELLCSCQSVIVNPEDERYTSLHGLTAIVPLYGREVKIQPHASAKPEFGSGAVMVCSYGDYTDVLLFRDMGLQEIVAVDESGKMTANAGDYMGLKVQEARRKMIEDLQIHDLVAKIDEVQHRTPICDRSKTPIEIIPMREFYVKQLDFVEDLKKLSDRMVFHPKAHKQILLDWIGSVNIDWPVSRRRYYATEIPVWYCKKCREPHVPEPNRYYRPWRDPAPFSKCVKCGFEDFEGDLRTFDTWMDSSISPLFITRYNVDEGVFKDFYPTSIRPQGKDIIRTWLYYTLLRCYQLTNVEPFQQVWIMGFGVDEKGERMSKSKGNVIDPLPLLKRYGADCFRLWAASEATLGSDFRCSEERIRGFSLFLTKLWNIARYISSFDFPVQADLQASDRWIIAELSAATKECLEGYSDFNFFIPANKVREFTWNTFAAHYMEMSKARAYGVGFTRAEQEAAWYTLHTCLRSILLLLAPVVPFITDHIWRSIYDPRGVHVNNFLELDGDNVYCKDTSKIIEWNSHIWNLKKSKGVSLRDPISVSIPAELQEYASDLKAMHRLE